MALLTGRPQLSGLDLYTSEAIASVPVGQINDGYLGRYFRYSYAGGAALVAGNLLQEAAVITSNINMAVATAGVVGDSSLAITNGTTTITNQQFVGGTLGVYTAGTVAVGDEYVITGVTGVFTTGGALRVYLDRPLRYAVTTGATVNINPNPWNGVIQFPVTTQTGMPVGVALFALPLNTYGWVQTHGVATALSDTSTYAVGSGLVPSLAVAGAVGVNVAGTTHTPIGVSRQAAASTKGTSIFLTID